jgi:hypothetical protein
MALKSFSALGDNDAMKARISLPVYKTSRTGRSGMNDAGHANI